MRIGSAIVFSLLIGGSLAASAAGHCEGVDRQLTPARQRQYAELIAKAITTPHTAKDVSVTKFLQSGPWSAVWGQAKDFEQGVFFFEDFGGEPRFVKTWGGWAVPEERPKLEEWVHTLGKSVPDNLATCFAATATAGH
jgi:hypothetical protein